MPTWRRNQPLPGPPKAVKLAEDYLDTLSNANTYATYADGIRRFLRWCHTHERDPLALTSEDMAYYRRWLATRPGTGSTPPAETTVRLYYRIACYLLHHWHSHGHLRRPNPAPLPRKQHDQSRRPAERLTTAEAQRLLEAAVVDDVLGPSLAPVLVVALMLFDGFTASEVCRLRPAELPRIDPNSEVAHVLVPGRRGAADHLVVLGPVAARFLIEHRRVDADGELLLRHPHQLRPLTRWDVYQLVRRLDRVVRVDLPGGLRPTDLAHTGHAGGPVAQRITARDAKQHLATVLSATARL